MIESRKKINKMAKLSGEINTGLIFGIALVLLLGISVAGFAISFAPFGLSRNPETLPNTSISGAKITCSTWDDNAVNYQNIITAAATNNVQTALLGAIFLAENGDSWDKAKLIAIDAAGNSASGSWGDSGSGAQGPFQFMPGTWPKYSSNGQRNIQNVSASASGAAEYLRDILTKDAQANKFAVDQNAITCAGIGYNGGGAKCQTWRKNGFDPNNMPSTNVAIGGPLAGQPYGTRVWKHFQDLYIGCQSITQILNQTSAGDSTGIIDFAGNMGQELGVRLNAIGPGTTHPLTSYNVYRSSDSVIANQIANAAYGRINSPTLPDSHGAEMPYHYRIGGVEEKNDHECKALVYYVMAAVGKPITSDESADTEFSGVGFIKVPGSSPKLQKGDIVHFTPISPYNGGTGGHWAVAY